MPGSIASGEPAMAGQTKLSDLALLPRRVYPLRTLGMGLAGLGIAVVLWENAAPWPLWCWLLFTGIVWPQLALWLARRSRDPYRTELRNLMFDSALAGIWVPLLEFNLLPSALLLTLATVDKINTGVRGLWLWALPGLLLGLLLAGLLTGFAMRPASSPLVIAAWLPMLMIHSIAVAANGYRLVRRVQRQNRLLDELSRTDVLTGLHSRGHWQDLATARLQAVQRGGGAATLLLIDVDHFKAINDSHGHAVGDDVLRLIAAAVRRGVRAGDHPGRYGGDEFAVVVEDSEAAALETAERIRRAVEQLVVPGLPALRITVSLGAAEARPRDIGLREWIESADRALYRAKSAGRNRVAGLRADAEGRCGAQPAASG